MNDTMDGGPKDPNNGDDIPSLPTEKVKSAADTAAQHERSERRRATRRTNVTADNERKLQEFRDMTPLVSPKPQDNVVPLRKPAGTPLSSVNIPELIHEETDQGQAPAPHSEDPHPYQTFFRGLLKLFSGKK